MSRQCKCGGEIREYHLIGNREAWTCNGCGRYEQRSLPDLFGDTITRPTVALKSLVNAAWGFTEFWQTWPNGTRKGNKQGCLNRWAKADCALNATLIRQHVEWMKTQDDWLRDYGRYICAPLVYLNQQRWHEWEPVAIKVKPARDPELAKLDNDKANAVPRSVWLAKQTKEIVV